MANKIVNTQAWKKESLDLKAAVFNAGKIVLNTSSGFTPAAGSVVTDIVEPTDSGYSRQTPAYAAATDYGPADAQILAAPLTWTFTLSGGSFTIYSICQVDSGGDLKWSFELDTPAVISAAGPWQCVPAYTDGDY